MPEIKSPLGNKTIQARPLKELDIPDESMDKINPELLRNFHEHHESQTYGNVDSPDNLAVEQYIRQAKEERRNNKVRLSEGARQRIEKLIGLVRGTHSVIIEGNEYAFQTLKSKEMRDAMNAASEFNGTVQFPYEMRKQLLAYSLTKVAGIPVDQFISSNNLVDKLMFIEELDDALINRLYEEYLVMIKNSKNRYEIVNEKDAKEVLQDLKK